VSDRQYYGVSIGIIAISLLVVVAVCGYSQSLTDDTVIQRFSALATAVAAAGGFFAFVTLVFYTIETRLLRKATEEQLEGGIRPVLLFDVSSEGRQLGAAMNLTTFQIKNIGAGPAFDVKVAPLVGDGVKLDVDEISLIESREVKSMEWSIAQSGKRSGMSSRPALLAHLITEAKFPAKMPVTVECKGLSGKRYRTHHELRYDPLERRVWTDFVRLEKG